MTKHRWILVAAAAGLAMAACGGDDGDGGIAAAEGGGDLVLHDGGGDLVLEGGDVVPADDAATDDPGDAATGEQPAATADDEEALALEFAQCMRDEGIDDWPDPELNPDGSINMVPTDGGLRPGAGGFQNGDLQGALESCGPIVEGASFLPDRAGGFDAETQDQFLEFTQCLRDNGLDVDDPDLGNLGGGGGGQGGPGAIFGAGFDPDDPATQAAIDACQGLFTGRPGGPFGGGS